MYSMGFPGSSAGKESACQCKRHGFLPWVGKIPWRRKWQPTPVFLPGKSHNRGTWRATVQFSSVAQSYPTLCDPMDCNTPGLPVHHQLPEFTQTHVHRVGDAIQPFHPLLSPSPTPFNLSQHQGLFK